MAEDDPTARRFHYRGGGARSNWDHVPKLRDRARGRWGSILPMLGLAPSYLTGKHGPCPLCKAGKDRWRFVDRDGSGDWYCTHCGHGSGTDLLMKFLQVDFKEAAMRIEGVIGQAVVRPTKPVSKPDAGQCLAAMRRVWDAAVLIEVGSAVDTYLRTKRGIGLNKFPAALRFGQGAMLAKVVSMDDRAVNIQRTFLTGGAARIERRLMPGPVPGGSAVRLAPGGPTLGIAEGIETALSAHLLFGVPVWAVLSAGNMEKFCPPKGVKNLIVFADNDKNFVGQRAAYFCANRAASAGVSVKIETPDKVGLDWNDVLIKRGLDQQSQAA